jgi:hypothetical protein
MTDKRKKLQDHIEKQGGNILVGYLNANPVYSNGTSESEKCMAFEILRVLNGFRRDGVEMKNLLAILSPELSVIEGLLGPVEIMYMEPSGESYHVALVGKEGKLDSK